MHMYYDWTILAGNSLTVNKGKYKNMFTAVLVGVRGSL